MLINGFHVLVENVPRMLSGSPSSSTSSMLTKVKTTRGGAQTPFFMSSNEVQFSNIHANEYYLYRVYEYKHQNESGKFYVIQGDVQEFYELTATQFRAKGPLKI
jgi:hypothetical protein